MEIRPIAHIHTDFPTKFGIPRQADIIPELEGTIVFEPEFSQPEAVRGLDGFDYVWLLWDFSLEHHERFKATSCPPRLGGKLSTGVFAARSPFHPNSIGLSSARLEQIEYTEKGPVLHVAGIDLADETPIYDIKPYVPLADAHPKARGGFTDEVPWQELSVRDPDRLISGSSLTDRQKKALYKVLAQDPRPRFDLKPESDRRYGFYFADLDVRFTVSGSVLTVCELASGIISKGSRR